MIPTFSIDFMLIFPLEKEEDEDDEENFFNVCQDFVFMGQKNTK